MVYPSAGLHFDRMLTKSYFLCLRRISLVFLRYISLSFAWLFRLILQVFITAFLFAIVWGRRNGAVHSVSAYRSWICSLLVVSLRIVILVLITKILYFVIFVTIPHILLIVYGFISLLSRFKLFSGLVSLHSRSGLTLSCSWFSLSCSLYSFLIFLFIIWIYVLDFSIIFQANFIWCVSSLVCWLLNIMLDFTKVHTSVRSG